MRLAAQMWRSFGGLVLLTLFQANSLQCQTAPNRYWVQFNGKELPELAVGHSTPFSLNSPEDFLSERSMQRRERQSISITAHDLPIAPSYVEAIAEIEELDIILKSKWFNAVTVRLRDTTFNIESLLDLPMVSAVKSVLQTGSKRPHVFEAADASQVRIGMESATTYGQGWGPLVQLNGNLSLIHISEPTRR